MALDPAVLAAIRGHIGSAEPPTEADLEVAYNRLGSAERVALEVIEGRLADMASRPASLTVQGDGTEDWSANLRVLGDKAKDLRKLVAPAGGDSASTGVSFLTRVRNSPR